MSQPPGPGKGMFLSLLQITQLSQQPLFLLFFWEDPSQKSFDTESNINLNLNSKHSFLNKTKTHLDTNFGELRSVRDSYKGVVR